MSIRIEPLTSSPLICAALSDILVETVAHGGRQFLSGRSFYLPLKT